MDPQKEHLLTVANRVHASLRKLKMGETATITCSKTFPFEEVRNYIWAYAFHKGKWFDCEYNKTTLVLFAKRAPPPPWQDPSLDDDPDEP